MSQEARWVDEVVEVAESRESERDMATEAGAKVEERIFEVGEEKKSMVVRSMRRCVLVLVLGWMVGLPVFCCALRRGCGGC